MTLLQGRRQAPLGRRAATTLAVTTLAAAGVLAGAGSAFAADPLSATPTSLTTLNTGTTNALPGFRLSGGNASAYLVSVTASNGVLSLAKTTGLTLAAGYPSFSGTEISFTGDRAAIDTALQSMTISEAVIGTTKVQVSAVPYDDGAALLGENGHVYLFQSSPEISYDAAKTAAAGLNYYGQPGYLVTINTKSENDLLSAKVRDAANAWIGAQGNLDGSDRTWRWETEPGTDKPIFTECSAPSVASSCAASDGAYNSWAYGEPNNGGGTVTEDRAVTNWQGSTGTWNDVEDDGGAYKSIIKGYVVEFGGQTNTDNSSTAGFTDAAMTSKTLNVQKAVPAATAKVTSASVLAGLANRLEVANLKPGSAATVSTSWGAKASVKANAKGALSMVIKVPNTLAAGTAQVTVVGTSAANKAVTLKASMAVKAIRGVEFPAGSAKLTKGEQTKLKAQVALLKTVKGVQLVPTSTGANSAANRAVSQNRAKAVRAYLATLGVKPATSIATGSFKGKKAVVAIRVTK